MKKILISLLTLSMISVVVCSNDTNTSALTYSDNIGLNFTFNTALTVSLSNASGGSSADLIINDLTPGTSSDSNIINVNVTTNNLNGYTLSSSVGSSTLHNSNNAIYDTDKLIHSSYTSSDNTDISTGTYTKPIFTNLASTVSTLSGFSDNAWGYTYSLDNGTTWINAHETTEGIKDTGYNGLPLYSTTPATLTTKSSPSISTGDIIQFKIAAKASTTQTEGEYNNVINFIVVGANNPTSFYDAFEEAASQPGSTITQLNGYYKMQDMTPAICNAVQVYDDDSHIQLIDIRDNEVYWIGKLKDNRCWLLDNLRLGSNDYTIDLTPQDTNIATAWTLPKGTESTNSYTEPRFNAVYKNDANVTNYGTASGRVGVYYNFCATSGGTYCYDEGSGIGDAGYDICPIAWHIPAINLDGYRGLYDKYTFLDATKDTSIQHNLSTPLSGRLNGAQQQMTNQYGWFWSSTHYDGSFMYRFNVAANGISFTGTELIRTWGVSVRCIANNS